MARGFLLCISLLLMGCSQEPDWYPLPAQRQTVEAGHLGRYVAMNHPNADAHLVRDISHLLESGTWRWAAEHPQLRFHLEDVRHLSFSMDFFIMENTFQHTGPVTLTFLINGRPFDKVRYDQAGEQHYEKPVPESLLLASRDNIVSIEPDKVWSSKEDGLTFSFILVSAGFVD